MRNYINIFLGASILLLTGCSGSDTYQGTWKATDTEGSKFEIRFEPKSFIIKDSSGKEANYEYTQNSVKIENGIRTYGIHLSDGRVYRIFFPFANDVSKGIIMLNSNVPIYTISRSSYIHYRDLYKLNEWNAP